MASRGTARGIAGRPPSRGCRRRSVSPIGPGVASIILSPMPEPSDADVKAYAARAWHLAAELKQDHWARELAERGPLATFEASQALLEHMRCLRPDWPSEAERSEDLAHHIALKRAIDRAAGAFPSATRR